MDATTLGFLVVGGIGLVLVLVALVIGEIGDFGHPDADGPFSLPAIASFIGAAGFVGAIPAAVLPDTLPTALRILISLAVGVVGATPVAWGAIRLSAALAHMSTDRTLTESDLLGTTGTVITAIPATGLGEVRLTVAGQPLKYFARAESALPVGTPVFVTGTPSPTSVEVISTAERVPPHLPPGADESPRGLAPPGDPTRPAPAG